MGRRGPSLATRLGQGHGSGSVRCHQLVLRNYGSQVSATPISCDFLRFVVLPFVRHLWRRIRGQLNNRQQQCLRVGQIRRVDHSWSAESKQVVSDKNLAIVAAVHVAAAVAVGIVVAACSLTLAALCVCNYGHYCYCSRLTTKSTCCRGASNSNLARLAIGKAVPQTATESIQLHLGKEIKCSFVIDTCPGPIARFTAN